MSGVFESIVGGTRTPREYDEYDIITVLRTISLTRWPFLSLQVPVTRVSHSFKLVRPNFQPRHVQEP